MRRRWVSGTSITAVAVGVILAYLVVMAGRWEPLAAAVQPPQSGPPAAALAMEPARTAPASPPVAAPAGNAGRAPTAPTVSTTPGTTSGTGPRPAPPAAFVPVSPAERATALRRRPVAPADGLAAIDTRYRTAVLEYRPGSTIPTGLTPLTARAWSVAVALDALWSAGTWRTPLSDADPYVKAVIGESIAAIDRPERMRLVVESAESVLVRLFVGRTRYALRVYWQNDRIEDAELWRDPDRIEDQDIRTAPIVGS